MKLVDVKCTPCQAGIPHISRDQAVQYLKEINEWKLVENATKLKKTSNFVIF